MSQASTPAETFAALAGDIEYFLKAFKDKDGNYKYFDMINDMMAKGVAYITLDADDLATYNFELATRLLDHPDEVCAAFHEAISSILREIHPDYAQEIHDEISVRVTNCARFVRSRDIDAKLKGKLVSFAGIQMSASRTQSLPKVIQYRCSNCDGLTEGKVKGPVVKKPLQCAKCGERDIEEDTEASIYINYQKIKIGELPEDVPVGNVPYSHECNLYGDLADNSRPGDRVLVTGIVRLLERKIHGFSTRDLGIDVVNIEQLDDKSSRFTISPDDIEWSRNFVGKPDAYGKFINSFAPRIYGHELMKEACMLAIVAGPSPDAERKESRHNINVLLCGDPGISKSEMLKFAAKVAPRAVYTSGRGSTAAGLTAALVKDRDGMLHLEAGACVLGDMGVVNIDETDKIKEEDLSGLHQVMEQQQCSIAKAGVTATLNTRVAIIAAANPRFGKYDPYKNLLDNVNMPVPLLTRFDVILIVRDIPDRESDLATMNTIDERDKPGYIAGDIDLERFRKHIAIAKKYDPEFTKAALDKLHSYYMKMRNVESDSMITVTPRQYEALRRLASARARLLLKEEVDDEDAERAIYIVDQMIKTAGVDVNTGKTDLGVLYGKPQSVVSKEKMFFEVFKELTGEQNNDVPNKTLVEELVKTGKFSDEEARAHIKKFSREGQIFERQPGIWAKT